ncbi:HNH endonuclease, partial [Escherichia coli]|nr:HNH endonuclease [Escherichia coli]
MAGQTISSDCDPPRGGDHPAKKTIAPDTAPRLMQRKNSCCRPVNMLTGCPGIF